MFSIFNALDEHFKKLGLAF